MIPMNVGCVWQISMSDSMSTGCLNPLMGFVDNRTAKPTLRKWFRHFAQYRQVETYTVTVISSETKHCWVMLWMNNCQGALIFNMNVLRDDHVEPSFSFAFQPWRCANASSIMTSIVYKSCICWWIARSDKLCWQWKISADRTLKLLFLCVDVVGLDNVYGWLQSFLNVSFCNFSIGVYINFRNKLSVKILVLMLMFILADVSKMFSWKLRILETLPRAMWVHNNQSWRFVVFENEN